MTNSAKFFRLAIVSAFFGAAVLCSAQPASAFSLNPIKAAKNIGKAVGGAAKTVGKAAGGAVKTVGKAAGTVGKTAVKTTGVVAKTAVKTTGKAIKLTGKAAGTVGKVAVKTTGVVAKTAFKTSGKIAMGAVRTTDKAIKTTGRAAVSVGKNVGRGIKTAANDAKNPLKAVGKLGKAAGQTALLATPAAPAIIAKRAVDTAKRPPKVSSYAPSAIGR